MNWIMLKLMKYEARRQVFSNSLSVGVLLVLLAAFYGFYRSGNVNRMGIMLSVMGAVTIMVLLFAPIQHWMLFHADINSRQGNMQLLLPQKATVVLGAKVLVALLQTIVLYGLFFTVVLYCERLAADTYGFSAGYVGKKLNVIGLVGGHSGMDIILYRANANKVMVRALLPLVKDLGAKLISVEGGNMRNAIPREAEAVIAVPADKVAEAEAVVAKVCAEVKVEYAATDKDANVYLEDAEVAGEAICQDVAVALCRALYVCPNGVERMSNAMPGLVETSNNMAIVKSEDGTIKVHSLMRSSVDTAKDDLAVRMRAAFELAGAEVSFAGGYSGWAPNMASPILREMKAVYEKLYGKQPAVMAIHAGLECGILGGTYPNWDMVSCGPTIFSPHSPDERVNIESVGKWWEFVKEVLKEAPKK